MSNYEVRRIPGDGQLEDAFEVRRSVFIEGQDVPEEIEMDGKDEDAVHFVIHDSQAERPVGTARLRPPEEIEMDGKDEDAVHFVIHDSQAERPVGTARLRPPEEGVAKPERVAVLEEYRGYGLGRKLMSLIEAEARSQGCERAALHAQTHVVEFYEDLGYEVVSDEFEEAGIPHVEMATEL